MLSRALTPTVLCGSALWSLTALACIYSMDLGYIRVSQPLWIDLVLWTAGAVFLNRVVLVDRLEDGTPRLIASLLARHAEMDGRYEPVLMGMPMGFPPIPHEEIDLISTWIEQGAPE